ncbi:hypothetical protein [Micromonospora sp. LOL_021]|uniref:hypothetical protein n=1 Tax=Micromonospora sp. LOL_021 TaxID=3345417 RepID=UPI003A8BD141
MTTTQASCLAAALTGRTVAWVAGAPTPALTAALAGIGARPPDAGPAHPDLVVADLRDGVAPTAVDRPGRAPAVLTAVFTAARAGRDLLTGGTDLTTGAAGGGLLLIAAAAPGPTGAALHAGLTSLTRTLATEWAPQQIRVNCLLTPENPAPPPLADLIGYLAGPAAALLTGQLLTLTPPAARPGRTA